MTNEPENMNEQNVGAEGSDAKPKKKKPIMIFRPQNSKTGAVRPGQRPGSPKKTADTAHPARPAAKRPAAPAKKSEVAAVEKTAAEPIVKPEVKAAPAAEKIMAAQEKPAVEVKAAVQEKTVDVQAAKIEQVKAPEVKPEPAKVQAPKTEPVKAEPAKTETANAVPAEAPMKAETVKAEPVKAEPVKAEPVKTEPVKAEPKAAEEKSESVKVQEIKSEPAKAQAPKNDFVKNTEGAPARSSERNNERSYDRGQGRNNDRPAGRSGERNFDRNSDRPAGRNNDRPGFRSNNDRPAGGRTYQDRPNGGFRSGDGRNAGSRDGNGAAGERRPFQGQSRPNGFSGKPGMGQGGSAGRPFNKDAGRDGGRDGARDGGSRPFGSRDGARRAAAPAPKPFEKEGRALNTRGKADRRNDKADRGDKFDRMEYARTQGGKNSSKAKAPVKMTKPVKPVVEETIKTITIPDTITLKDLADKLKIAPAVIVKKLFMQGKMVTVNEEIDFDAAEEIALEYDVICEKEVKINVLEELLKDMEDDPETLVSRPPVVCVMGHVDHGKTSLLDAIRDTHVTDREAGGITQHIGASVVTCNGQKITFLDTPGHEAFTAMRMRGANSTDIAILVVAADDGVKPQTIEAINHARAAGIEIIVAINKIDKPGANIERVKQELTEYQLVAEDWGGSTIVAPVSAKTHEGIDELLEMVLLTAEVMELKANPNRRARGLVIEAQLDKGRGPVATVLVQKGTLHVGDAIAAGSCSGRIRAMKDDKGRSVKEAGPSTPVEIQGFSDVPGAGEIMVSPETEKEARSFAETFISEGKERLIEETKQKMSLDDLFSQIKAGTLKELNLIVKADVQGSVEAVKQSLLKLSNEEVVVKIIHSGAGAINESDVTLASASNAIIIGFNIQPDPVAKATAEHEGVDVRLYRVIYDAINDVEAAMKGMLDPIYEEKIIGHAEIRQIFKASGVGAIAGSYVLDGMFQRGCKARITRGTKQIFDGNVASLKRFKDDVKEVKAGYECGLVFEKFNDIAEMDQVEAYIMEEVPR